MSGDNWVRAAATSEVAEGEPLGSKAGGRDIAIYLVDGTYFATSNICTHAFALLSDGWLEGCTIECPLHNGRFDIRTGHALSSPVERDLETFAVEVRDGALYVRLPS